VVLKDIDECAEEAKITLKDKSGRVIDTALTNNYGDFKIDDLEKKSGKYSLEIAYSRYQKQELTVDLENSINVGIIFL
jgi:hypothetical protein